MRLFLTALVGLALLSSTGRSGCAEAGAWVLRPGQTWVQLALMHQQTDERYFLTGDRIPYFFEGESRTAGLFLDVRHGLPGGLEVDLQVPFFDQRFDDLADQRRSTGIGDVRAALRYNAIEEPLVATVGASVKLPTGDFETDAEVIPVGEGQWDVGLSLELARSLWPRPGYLTGLVGYRLRAENLESGIHPGNELLWSLEAGYRVLPRTTLKVRARGLHGEESTSFGITIPTLKREVVYLVPGLIFDLGAARAVEEAEPFTMRGRNWPAGPVLTLAFRKTF
jgi:hypothetical protein